MVQLVQQTVRLHLEGLQGNKQISDRGRRVRCSWLWTLLTGDGAQVKVVPDHLLELVIQGALLKLQAEVVPQISVQHLTWGRGERNLHQFNDEKSICTELISKHPLEYLYYIKH